MQKVEIRPKNPDSPLTGANCELLIDGKPLEGVTRLVLSIDASNVAILSLEMIGPIKVIGSFEEKQIFNK